MKFSLGRLCLVSLGAAALFALTGCSELGNGYGGWYWQMPEISTPMSMNQTGTANQTHANSGKTPASHG